MKNMGNEKYNFQYCQKIVVFSRDRSKILLCKRRGEADYDGTFSFIGGKLETGDGSILDGLRREKNEEVGADFKIRIYLDFSTNVFFVKKDGSSMILPHYYAEHLEGEINLSDEYSEFGWIPIEEVPAFEPKVETIPYIIERLVPARETLIKGKSEII